MSLVDLARLFPPQKPVAGVKGCFLYKLFRSEFLKKYPVPISSDCFSFWGTSFSLFSHILKIEKGREEPDNNIEAERATGYLINNVIPQLISSGELDRSNDIKTVLHSWGVNIRFLCILYSKVTDSELRKSLAVQVLYSLPKHSIFDR